MGLTRKVHLAVISFALFFLFSFSLTASEKPSFEEQIGMASQARDLILHRKYDEAEGVLKNIVEQWPDDLLGYFGLMALDQIRNLENYDFRFDPDYKTWEERGRSLALETAKDPGAQAWDMLKAGAVLGISGFYRAHNGKWFAAMRDTSLGFHTVDKAYKKDKSLTEALLGVGLYDYWQSYFTRKLLFLPFFADRREQGKEELRLARDESRFASILAEIALLFIDFQEKKYDQVMASVDHLLEKYPENTILRFLKGEIFLKERRYEDVVAQFEKILQIDPSIHKAYLYIGLALAAENKDPEKAKAMLHKYLDLEPKASPDWRKPAVERLKTLEKE